jgi:hypothetical protein
MNKWVKTATLVIVAFAVSTVSIAAKPKPKPKPPIKKPVATTKEQPHYVKGTTQLSGENAQLNTTYTLGKAEPFNITLKSAEYSVEPILIGDVLHTVTKDEKFLVLHMIYHNPQNKEVYIRWDSFGFTVVDSKDQNWDGIIDLGAEGEKSSVSMSFKPAQKKDLFAAIKVPSNSEMPKLIIKSNDQQVLRYDLRGKVKGLPAIYADLADKTGATALPEITCANDIAYPIGAFSFKLNKIEFSTKAKMGDTELGEGEKFCLVNFTLKNMAPGKTYFRWDSLSRKLVDTDGVEAGECTDVFPVSKDKTYEADMVPGQEITLRYLFKIPADSTLKSFTNTAENFRTLVYDISNVK